MTPNDLIQKQLEQDIVLYMKGTADQPLCGFSHQAVTILQQCAQQYNIPFEIVDVIANPAIKQELKKRWPLFPQLYIKREETHGELVGGSDIIKTLYSNGKLQEEFKRIKSLRDK